MVRPLGEWCSCDISLEVLMVEKVEGEEVRRLMARRWLWLSRQEVIRAFKKKIKKRGNEGLDRDRGVRWSSGVWQTWIRFLRPQPSPLLRALRPWASYLTFFFFLLHLLVFRVRENKQLLRLRKIFLRWSIIAKYLVPRKDAVNVNSVFIEVVVRGWCCGWGKEWSLRLRPRILSWVTG